MMPKAALGLAVVTCLPAPANALGLRLADQDAEATARGNAFVATADNPAAVYYNPAGITQLAGLQTRVGAYGITLRSDYRSLAGREVSSKQEYAAAPQFYLTWTPGDHPVSFGLGVYSPYGLSLEWPDNSGFRTLASRGSILYYTVNPVIAWEVLPTLSIAAGPTFNYSDTDLRRGILAPGDQYRFEGDALDYGFTAGVRWQIHPKHSLGLNYRAATRMDYTGHYSLQSVVPLVPSAAGAGSTAGFNFPQNIVFGWSYRPSKDWNLEFDADWTDWQRLRTVTLNQQGALPVQLPFNWRSSWFYEWGVTRHLGNGWDLSAGYIFSENSVPDQNFNPLVPDSDRHIFSVGIGHKGKRWGWDASYQFAYGPPRTVNNSVSTSFIGESADGRYRFESHALAVSAGYSF